MDACPSRVELCFALHDFAQCKHGFCLDVVVLVLQFPCEGFNLWLNLRLSGAEVAEAISASFLRVTCEVSSVLATCESKLLLPIGNLVGVVGLCHEREI